MDLIRKCVLFGTTVAFSLISMSVFACSHHCQNGLIVYNYLPNKFTLLFNYGIERIGKGKTGICGDRVYKMCGNQDPCIISVTTKENVKEVGSLSIHINHDDDKDSKYAVNIVDVKNDHHSPYKITFAKNVLSLNLIVR